MTTQAHGKTKAHGNGLSIAEVSARTGLTAHTLRYYERDGLMLGVGRNGSGHRAYTEGDLGWITLITRLRSTGMPIREIRRYAEMVRDGAGNEEARLALLRAHRDRVRAQLEETAAHLDAIEFKVSYYATAVGETDPDAELRDGVGSHAIPIAQQRRAEPSAPR